MIYFVSQTSVQGRDAMATYPNHFHASRERKFRCRSPEGLSRAQRLNARQYGTAGILASCLLAVLVPISVALKRRLSGASLPCGPMGRSTLRPPDSSDEFRGLSTTKSCPVAHIPCEGL